MRTLKDKLIRVNYEYEEINVLKYRSSSNGKEFLKILSNLLQAMLSLHGDVDNAITPPTESGID